MNRNEGGKLQGGMLSYASFLARKGGESEWARRNSG